MATLLKKNILIIFYSHILFFLSCSENNNKSSAQIKNNDTTQQQRYVPPTGTTPGKLVTTGRACYFDDISTIQKTLEIQLDSAEKRELGIINEIMKYTGLPANFTIYKGDVSNALATNYEDTRLIIYNEDMFNLIDRQSQSFWSSVFIMAHEIGHHLTNNISEKYPPIQAELEADAFAANVLYKMGADTIQTLSALQSNFISNSMDTKTHPSKTKRLENAIKSWKNANMLQYDAAIPPEPNDDVKNWEISGFGKEELWDNWIMNEEIMPSSIKLYKDLEGVVLGTKKLNDRLGGQKEANGAEGRYFEVTILITKIPKGISDPAPYALNSKVKFEVHFAPFGSDGEDSDAIFTFFKPGRRITFSVNYYLDNIGSNEKIIAVSTTTH